MKIFLEIENLKGRSRDERLESVISSVPGIWAVNVDHETGWVDVECQPRLVLEIVCRIELAGYRVISTGMTHGSTSLACRVQ